ncbi:MAG TPA: O-antigen ligase family protein [Anaerolineales bacterium]|nr:O-antigen ligase family protein [Anaerolineales bacterium]
MSSITIFSRPNISTIKSNVTLYAVLLGGAGLAVVMGYLVVRGEWITALGLLFVLPSFILLHKYPWLALLIWLFLVPLFTITPDPGGRRIYWLAHRALPPVTLIVMLIASRLQINIRRFPKMGWPELAMVMYLLVSLSSIILLNDSPRSTFYHFYDRVISPMCLYLIIRLWAPNKDDHRRLAPVVFFLLVFQIVIGLLAWYTPQILPSAWVQEELRTTGTVSSYGAYAATMIFSGLFLLQSALSQRVGLVRNLYLFSFILASFGVFMSFSRGAWAAGTLVILGLLLIDRKRLIRVGLIVVPLVYGLAAGPLAGQIEWASERLYSERSEESALIRLPVFQASLRMLAEKPFFGWGYENFNRYDWQFYSAVEGVLAPVKNLSSHNFYLTLLAEQGFVGTLLFLFPFFWWLVRSLKKMPSLPADGFWGRRSLILSWLFIFAYMTVNMFHNMRVVFGLGLWWVGLALIANAVERPDRSDRSETTSHAYPTIGHIGRSL